MQPCVFLDRDGTLIVEKDYLSDPAGVALIPGTAGALRRLRAAGYRLVVVTNQAGIGRGYYTRADFDRVQARFQELLAAEGAGVDAVYFCPHHPQDGCRCRKPEPGMIEQAAADGPFDAARSFVVGDKPCDVDLAQRAGMRGILVRTGYGAEHEQEGACRPAYVAHDLADAADWIIRVAAEEA